MRIITSALLSGLLVLLTACGGNGSKSQSANIPASSSNNSSVSSEAPVISSSASSIAAGLYPNYNTNPTAPDNTGMTRNAVQIADAIHVGWNIGNTLEAIGGETAWGNPLVSNELIQLVKANGFNAIRIPVSWNQHANPQTAAIDPSWLNRVKDVVQLCIDNDMYVMVNIHWDGGWLENNINAAKQAETNARQKAFWEQIATHLRDFDERLMFASANEPDVEKAEHMDVLRTYHQTFVDAVRATGGKNAWRVLIVQGPKTDIELSHTLWTDMPTDSPAERLMFEVHFYTPFNFTLMRTDESWGKQFFYWGEGFHSTTDTDRNPTWGEESTVDDLFGQMKSQFVDQGIPVVLGEFAAMRRDDLTGEALEQHLASRAYYLSYVTRSAIANGLLPFYWDTGALDNFGSGIFDRKTHQVFDQPALDALTKTPKIQP
jgi:endoglucanase